MLGTPTQCPSCAAVVSPFDTRCPACRQVLGPDNICDRCQALAPTIARHGRLLCSACESERTRRPHTVVVRDRELRWSLAWERFRLRIYAFVAVTFALFNGTVGGLTLHFGDSDFSRFIAAAFLLGAALIPLLLFMLAKRARKLSKAREQFTLRQRLLGLAYKRGGVLTAADVAQNLNIPLAAADAMLDQLVHQQKAEIEVTDRGEIQFVFGPARLTSGTSRDVGASTSPSAAARASRRGTESA
ncbi:MAG: hypothetical protein ABW252_02780 [Polyangiales bacterium]